jgi:hypothetical protein
MMKLMQTTVEQKTTLKTVSQLAGEHVVVLLQERILLWLELVEPQDPAEAVDVLVC